MRADVYKQAFDYSLPHNTPRSLVVTEQDRQVGYVQIDCPDCDGSGEFLMPDDSGVVCAACKGSGREWVAL